MKKILFIALCVIAINQFTTEFEKAKEQVLGTETETVQLQVAEEEQEVEVGVEVEEQIDYNQPVYFVESDGNVEYKYLVRTEVSYGKVPENVRVKFQEDGGHIYVTESELGTKYEIGTRTKGIFIKSHDTEKNPTYNIYIEDREETINTVIHEMGHYVDYRVDCISDSEEFQIIHATEVSAFAATYNTHENNYSKANEYFAESFMNCFVDAEGMQANCPKTYDFIMNVVENF